MNVCLHPVCIPGIPRNGCDPEGEKAVTESEWLHEWMYSLQINSLLLKDKVN